MVVVAGPGRCGIILYIGFLAHNSPRRRRRRFLPRQILTGGGDATRRRRHRVMRTDADAISDAGTGTLASNSGGGGVKSANQVDRRS